MKKYKYEVFTSKPNDIVAIESPCVFSMLEVIASLRLRTIEIPVREEAGLDTESIKKELY